MRDRLADKRVQAVLKWGGRAVTVAILAYLIYRLGQLGWRDLWSALPRNPLFYLLFVAIYMAQPLAELWIYRQIWPLPAMAGMRALIKKRVFNEEMAGYSGEVYFFWWLRDSLSTSWSEAFRAVRDINILSSVAALTTAFGLLGVLTATGVLELERLFTNVGRAQVIVAGVVLVVVVAILARFRKYIFALPGGLSSRILGIHYLRLLVVNTLVLLQWMVGVPEIGVMTWLTYLCLLIILNRIPFLPSKDLFFLTLGIELSSTLGHATTAIAGMLLAASMLVRITNVVLFIVSHYGDQRWKAEAAARESADEAEQDAAPEVPAKTA
ncbi:MAG: hypothetical protein JJ896_00410 [Rhodothermales bacterium]|nr:hypothetical protein [Rhodothermales bacterium]MBO6778088.1 hypothetical protein [Rhodothermales bacterium]